MIKILVVLLVVYLLVCGFMYLMQERLIFYPRPLPEHHAFSFTFEKNWDEVWLERENARLHALWFHAKKPKGVVLYFHGNAGSVAEWGEIAPEFVQRGYDLLLTDYRGYGKSTGSLTQKALLEDAEAFYEHLLGTYTENQIVVLGRSMGSGPAAYVAARHEPRHLILETPYYSLLDLAREKFPWLPHRWLLRFPLPTHTFLREVKCPVTLVHGTADELIPHQHSERLAQLLPAGQGELVQIPDAAHNGLDLYPEFQQMLDRVLGERGP